MASNPMQRKARNSFLAGVLITTLILGCVIGFLMFQMYSDKKEQEAIENAKKHVYILAQDVKAGANVISQDTTAAALLTTMEVDSQLVPETALTLSTYAATVTENTLFKIELKKGTVLTQEMLVESEDVTSHDTREQEYNMIILPTYLQPDDYVDIRLRLLSGEDYIVASKKKVVDTNETTIWMNLSEDEILTLSNAIVEAYIMGGAELYATTYIEPGIQGTATVTYVPSMSVIQLIENDPNVVQKAKEELKSRYNIEALINGRLNIINSQIASIESGVAAESVAAGLSASIEARKQSRAEYLQELESTATTTTVQ